MYDAHSPFLKARRSTAEPPRPGSKVELAIRALRAAILACELAPGEKVNEQEISDRFGFGRAAVRAAFAHLAGEKLLEVLPRSGWRVRPLTARGVRDVAAARRMLEPLLIAGPLPAAMIGQLERLAAVTDAVSDRPERSALATGRAYDRQFLEGLCTGRNPWLSRWLAEAWDESARITAFLEARSGETLPLPRRMPLLRALKAGDQTAACNALLHPIGQFEDFAAAALMSLQFDISVPGEAHRPPSFTGPVPAAGPHEQDQEKLNPPEDGRN